MTKLLLSTGNIVSGGPSIIRKPGAFRSNLELTNSLRSNFLAAQEEAEEYEEAHSSEGEKDGTNGHATAPAVNGNGYANGSTLLPKETIGGKQQRPPLAAWTQQDGSTLYVPRIDWPVQAGAAGEGAGAGDAETGSASSSSGGLQEDESQYDTTVKLFFLPGSGPVAERARHAEEALGLVFRELGVASIDLLVLSFPGMSFEGNCEWEADKMNAAQGNDEEEAATWAAAAEPLVQQGTVRRLGVAEFGSEKLARFLKRVAVSPAVDQINIRNCCNVPPPLASLAKERGIELLVHTDCTDVLPPGTLRELLGQGLQGAGVLADDHAVNEKGEEGVPEDALHGDLTPQWVVKYTAVVRDRGVIENKGYFAGALLHD